MSPRCFPTPSGEKCPTRTEFSGVLSRNLSYHDFILLMQSCNHCRDWSQQVKLFFVAGIFYYLTVPMAHELKTLSFVISPQATAITVLKIAVATVCVSFGYAMVTVLKEGPIATYEDRSSDGDDFSHKNFCLENVCLQVGEISNPQFPKYHSARNLALLQAIVGLTLQFLLGCHSIHFGFDKK